MSDIEASDDELLKGGSIGDLSGGGDDLDIGTDDELLSAAKEGGLLDDDDVGRALNDSKPLVSDDELLKTDKKAEGIEDSVNISDDELLKASGKEDSGIVDDDLLLSSTNDVAADQAAAPPAAKPKEPTPPPAPEPVKESEPVDEPASGNADLSDAEQLGETAGPESNIRDEDLLKSARSADDDLLASRGKSHANDSVDPNISKASALMNSANDDELLQASGAEDDELLQASGTAEPPSPPPKTPTARVAASDDVLLQTTPRTDGEIRELLGTPRSDAHPPAHNVTDDELLKDREITPGPSEDDEALLRRNTPHRSPSKGDLGEPFDPALLDEMPLTEDELGEAAELSRPPSAAPSPAKAAAPSPTRQQGPPAAASSNAARRADSDDFGFGSGVDLSFDPGATAGSAGAGSASEFALPDFDASGGASAEFQVEQADTLRSSPAERKRDRREKFPVLRQPGTSSASFPIEPAFTPMDDVKSLLKQSRRAERKQMRQQQIADGYKVTYRVQETFKLGNDYARSAQHRIEQLRAGRKEARDRLHHELAVANSPHVRHREVVRTEKTFPRSAAASTAEAEELALSMTRGMTTMRPDELTMATAQQLTRSPSPSPIGHGYYSEATLRDADRRRRDVEDEFALYEYRRAMELETQRKAKPVVDDPPAARVDGRPPSFRMGMKNLHPRPVIRTPSPDEQRRLRDARKGSAQRVAELRAAQRAKESPEKRRERLTPTPSPSPRVEEYGTPTKLSARKPRKPPPPRQGNARGLG